MSEAEQWRRERILVGRRRQKAARRLYRSASRSYSAWWLVGIAVLMVTAALRFL